MTGYVPPAALPSHVLDRDVVRHALAHHDFGHLFRLTRQWAGISYSKISESTGIKPDRIGAIARGHATITSYTKITDVADGLRIPGHLLGLTPRPWETGEPHASATPSPTPPQSPPVAQLEPGAAALGAGIGSQLLDAHRCLAGGHPTTAALDGVEAIAGWLHHHYAALSPAVLMPCLVEQTHLLVTALRAPLRIAERSRVCAALGEIAGLRAWLMFDLGDLPASSAWFAVARRAADEATSRELTAWLWGAQSLHYSYAGDHRSALDVLHRGLTALADPRGSRVAGWLHACAARSYAAIGSTAQFRSAWRSATTARDSGTVRHGLDMADGHLDVGYYGGGAFLALRQPHRAREVLAPSLDALPPARAKARTVLRLAVAASHAQDGDAEQAVQLAVDALSLPPEQCIAPIVRRARDVRTEIARLGEPRAVGRLDERLAALAAPAPPPSPATLPTGPPR
jgi:hypothetical protein